MTTHNHNKDGFSLIETMIAMFILVFALVSLAQMLALAIAINKNQGRDATKATGFAHDKMEELNSLVFNDTTTNVSTNCCPYTTTVNTGLTALGSIAPAPTVTNYVDYLDQNGVRTTSTSTALAFTRQWQITNITDFPAPTPTRKQITVSVTSNKSIRPGTAPVTVSVTFKARQ
jgi:prepilin-type N-terminal cleavage/methylation domain-containing protein